MFSHPKPSRTIYVTNKFISPVVFQILDYFTKQTAIKLLVTLIALKHDMRHHQRTKWDTFSLLFTLLTSCTSFFVAYAWSQWGYYGQCSKPCGGGVQYRTRTCERTQHYGYRSGSHSTQCYGPSSSQRRCNLQCCPVNGGWGQWSVWSNSHHGSYQQTRYRSCNYPRPSCGGQQCYGESTQTKNLPSEFIKISLWWVKFLAIQITLTTRLRVIEPQKICRVNLTVMFGGFAIFIFI